MDHAADAARLARNATDAARNGRTKLTVTLEIDAPAQDEADLSAMMDTILSIIDQSATHAGDSAGRVRQMARTMAAKQADTIEIAMIGSALKVAAKALQEKALGSHMAPPFGDRIELSRGELNMTLVRKRVE